MRSTLFSPVSAPLSPVPLYFSSLSLLRTALHYLNASNRLTGEGFKPGEWGYSLIWPIRGCDAGQGMVIGLTVLNMGIKFCASLS